MGEMTNVKPPVPEVGAKFKGKRTLAFSAAVALLGLLEMTNWADILPNNRYQGMALMVIGLITAYLRSITTTPVGKGAQADREN